MYSSGCHIRKRLRAVLGASLLLGTTAFAADEPTNLVFTAYSNVSGGASLISGDYGTALRVLGEKTPAATLSPAAASNNRCIALAVNRKWDAAHTACDTAVKDAKRERDTLPSYQIWARPQADTSLAVALSNRAVLNWLAADVTAAELDMSKAQLLAPHAQFVANNRTVMLRSLSSAEFINRPRPVVLEKP
jgi:hypothetical protein